MRVRRSVPLGLLTVLLGLTGCTADAPAPPQERAAMPDYEPPAGAPAICAGLADSTYFLGIPAAMGELAAGVGGVDDRSRLAAARGELRGLVEGLPADEQPELAAAADGLLAALLGVLDPPLTDEARSAVVASMEELVARLGPVCEFTA